MKVVIAYLSSVLLALAVAFLAYGQGLLPSWMNRFQLPYLCALAGGLGGVTYCLRGVYLNACILKQWDKVWLPWYFIRPLVSVLCGAISYVFLRAGLLVLEASKASDATNLGFLALAFISGLNVDKFIAKIEDVAQATWGIEKSRVAKASKEGN